MPNCLVNHAWPKHCNEFSTRGHSPQINLLGAESADYIGRWSLRSWICPYVKSGWQNMVTNLQLCHTSIINQHIKHTRVANNRTDSIDVLLAVMLSWSSSWRPAVGVSWSARAAFHELSIQKSWLDSSSSCFGCIYDSVRHILFPSGSSNWPARGMRMWLNLIYLLKHIQLCFIYDNS